MFMERRKQQQEAVKDHEVLQGVGEEQGVLQEQGRSSSPTFTPNSPTYTPQSP